MEIKENLYQYCLDDVNKRLKQIKDELHSTQEAANEETKSSAGDKYETGRAMAQLEVERYRNQLFETEKALKTLSDLSQKINLKKVVSGSLVRTDNVNFYIAISLGTVKINDEVFLVVSTASPIGQLLLGKTLGDKFKWNNKDYNIRSIE